MSFRIFRPRTIAFFRELNVEIMKKSSLPPNVRCLRQKGSDTFSRLRPKSVANTLEREIVSRKPFYDDNQGSEVAEGTSGNSRGIVLI